ncbi:sulfatase family protein [Gimesia fumaroli]|uniref:Arylsulfatase n=1 Tax=Gimesia fumaroli TaxID=2527976 RepID=A0A518IJF6_9PLAN|nr:sulfatase [Gimesia fumaroli]QDV53218.1 Arylsulfatase [Gimesia fumaroli]
MKKQSVFLLCAIIGLLFSENVIQAESTTAKASRPNILFCIADDASFPHMGAYGCSWVKTPGFDRVAREGLLFTNAYTPNAKCAPSRACILTGRNSWQLKEAGNHMAFFPPEFKTYVEALADAGYVVGKTAKGWAPGSAVDANGKRRDLAGPTFNQQKAKPPATGISSIDYAANFEQFLKTCPQDQSWCFWYGGLEPHRRYEYGSGVKKAGKKTSDIDRVPSYWPDNEVIRNDMLDYAFEIEHFDQHLVRMLKSLEERNQLDNTIIVVTADNGMPFPRVKGQEYERSNHLPLAIMWKQGIKTGDRVIDDYVSFIDFAPTFVEAARLNWEQTGMQPTAGRSLTDIFESDKSGTVNPKRDHVLIGKERHDIGRPHDWGYPIRGIVKDGMLYLKNDEPGRWPAGNPETGYLNCDGSPTKTTILELRRDGKQEQFWQWAFGKRTAEELYSIQDDPECMKNLAALPKFQSIKNALKEQMHAELTAQKDPRVLGNGSVFEKYQYSDPRTRNFYQRYQKGDAPKAGWVNKSDFESGPLD